MIRISICLSDLPKDKIITALNGKRYIDLILAKRQNEGKYGETHTLSVSKTKEERAAKTPAYYVGSGKEYDFGGQNASGQVSQHAVNHDDLPF